MATFLCGAISMGTVFLLGCVGEIITEKAGHLNLGIPGIMCMGAAGGCTGVSIYMSMFTNIQALDYFMLILLPVLGAVIFAGFGGAIYGFLTVSMRANQNVTGLALTTFGAGFTQFIFKTVVNTGNFSKAAKLITKSLSFADKLGWFGEIFLSHGIFVYMAIAIAIATAIVLRKTKVGLSLRAVGESPATADAVGINVTKYKYGAILVGSAIAGLGGLFYVMDFNFGTFDNTSTIQAFGWLAIALVIFTMWKPDLAILGSIIFGGLYIASAHIIGVSKTTTQIIKLLPYIVTIIVLIITSIVGKKETQPPASLGLNYFREER